MNEVKVIEEFLANWRANAEVFYTEEYARFRELVTTYQSLLEKYDLYSVPATWRFMFREDGSHPHYPQDFLEAKKAWNNWKEYTTKSIQNIIGDMNMDKKNANQILDKFLTKQVDNKRKQLQSKVEKAVGTVTDASELFIGVDGNINGTVTGTLNTATVKTIYAGGYNIQCLHYRTLVRV